MPADWITEAMPETSRSALTSRQCLGVQPNGGPDDERYRHGAGVHDEQVLQAQDEQARRGGT